MICVKAVNITVQDLSEAKQLPELDSYVTM